MCELKSITLYLFILIAMNFVVISTIQMESTVNNGNLNATYPITTTTIERTAIFGNGCYKQRIIEPDLWNSKRYFETEQLVCPPAVNASIFTTMMHQLQLNSSTANRTTHIMPANNTAYYASLPPPGNIPAKNFLNLSHNITHVSHLPPVESNHFAVLPPPAVPTGTRPANPISTNITSRAAVLSKKTGFFSHEKKKNSAITLNNLNWFALFAVITIISKF